MKIFPGLAGLRDRLMAAMVALAQQRTSSPIRIGPGKRTHPRQYQLRVLSAHVEKREGGPRLGVKVQRCTLQPKKAYPKLFTDGDTVRARRIKQFKWISFERSLEPAGAFSKLMHSGSIVLPQNCHNVYG